MIFKFFPCTFSIMLLFDEVGFRDAGLSRIWSLITASGFIKHMKAVARGKLKGLILQSEMPLSMVVLLNGNIFQDFMTNQMKKFRR